MELADFKPSPKIIPYQVLGLTTALLGFLCTFYVPVVEVILEVDFLVTFKSTESFTFQGLREQMIERNISVRNTNISIAVLLIGSLVNIVSVKKVRLLLLGSTLQLLSFVILHYDATGSTTGGNSDSFLNDAVSINPTVWLYALIGGVMVAVIASAGRETINLVSAYRDN